MKPTTDYQRIYPDDAVVMSRLQADWLRDKGRPMTDCEIAVALVALAAVWQIEGTEKHEGGG